MAPWEVRTTNVYFMAHISGTLGRAIVRGRKSGRGQNCGALRAPFYCPPLSIIFLRYCTVDEYCTEGKALWSVSDDGQLRIFDIRNKLMVRGRMKREHNSCTYVV